MKTISIFISVIAIFFAMSCGGDQQNAEKMALDAAAQWIEMLDNGNIEKCYDLSAEHMKKSANRETFVEAVGNQRKTDGKIVQRKLEQKMYSTTMNGMPDGEYFGAEYSTKFDVGGDSKESITLIKEADGVWRVAGYHVKH